MEVVRMNRNCARLLVLLSITFCGFSAELVAQSSGPVEEESPMALSADAGFEVATIHPSDSNDPQAAKGWTFESEGHRIACKQATLLDIISMAYAIQRRQIVDGPAWLSKDRYDIVGTPDQPGVPNVKQTQSMYKKLLADRFHLTLHKDTREMPIYALTVAKGGPLLNTANPQEPVNTGNSGSGGQRTLKFTNMSMPNFALNLNFYEDRPVVDQTSLPGYYDFTLKWTFDLASEGEPGAPPSLFTAVREQLGLRLDAVKGFAEVLVIDHVERPSEN
jgi:uncharacterized protein (TIGR03435 family)